MGFWHTDSTDLMSGTGVSGCDADLSRRERFHAGIAFSRELGNTDVDNAPRTTTSTLGQTVIVD